MKPLGLFFVGVGVGVFVFSLGISTMPDNTRISLAAIEAALTGGLTSSGKAIVWGLISFTAGLAFLSDK